MQGNYRMILPNDKLEVGATYWLNTFKGYSNRFINHLKREKLNLVVTYSTSSRQRISKTITIEPDLKNYK